MDMEKKNAGDYVSPDVKVIRINLTHAILDGSIDAVNEYYEEEDI